MAFSCRYLPFFAFLAFFGCVGPKPFERLVATSRPTRPMWIREKLPPKEGKEFFVGQAVAANVLDERRALLKARQDAAYNIAFSILAEIRGVTYWRDYQRGDEVHGTESLDTDLDHSLRILVDELISGMRVEESYWELWEVRSPVHHVGRGEENDTFRRYKYFVLMSIPRKELARLRELAKKNVASS